MAKIWTCFWSYIQKNFAHNRDRSFRAWQVIKRRSLTNFGLFQDIRGLQNQELIEKLQDQVHTNMQEYITHHYPGQPNRFGNVLLRLPELRSISTKITERLFFLNVTHAFSINTRLNEFLYTLK